MTNYVMPPTDDVPGVRGFTLPLGDAADVTKECLEYLMEVVRSRPEGRQMQTGVTAAARVLDWAKWREERDGAPEEALLALMGSPERALEWMRKMQPRLEALAARKALGAKEDGGGETESR